MAYVCAQSDQCCSDCRKVADVGSKGKHDFHGACCYDARTAILGGAILDRFMTNGFMTNNDVLDGGNTDSGRGGFGVVNTGARVGERLRAIRRQKGLSLHDVEARSSLEFKASVLGAYERGERAISVPRLLRLAEIYEVPADQLLPRESESEINLAEAGSTALA